VRSCVIGQRKEEGGLIGRLGGSSGRSFGTIRETKQGYGVRSAEGEGGLLSGRLHIHRFDCGRPTCKKVILPGR